MQTEKTFGNVSPSWLKAIYNGGCPRRIAAAMITKEHPETFSSAAINKGIRFEYLCIGTPNENKAYNGTTPLMTEKTGKVSADEDKAQAAAEIYKQFEKSVKIEYRDKQRVLQVGNTKAIPDYTAVIEINNERKFIAADLKYSSLLGNKFEKGGWHTEKFIRNDFSGDYKDYTNLFAPVLVYILAKENGVELDYYFYIVASDNDFQIFAIKSDTINDFCLSVVDAINEYRTLYYEPVLQAKDHFAAPTKPNFKNCDGCPLADNCKDFTNVPTIHFI